MLLRQLLIVVAEGLADPCRVAAGRRFPGVPGGVEPSAGNQRPKGGVRVSRSLIAAVVAVAGTLVLAPAASAVDDVNTRALRQGVTTAGILNHMRAFQRLANANGGNRAAAFPGYDASLAYVERRLTRAGYDVERHPFDFARWEQNAPATLQREGQPPYIEGDADNANDYFVAQFSGSGSVTAPLVTTNDIQIPPPGGPGTGTSGCEREDWPAGDQPLAGKIALIQRGTCTFVAKIQLAKDLGAVGVIIFNDGGPGREEPFQIGAPQFIGIPVVMTSATVGAELYNALQQGPVNVTLIVDATTTEVTQHNLIADTEAGDPERTIVVGAHLDSVEEGPGVNDNASGSGTLIEMAEEIAKLNREPRNRIRFAWWGAEEAGLVGSTAYVADLIESGEIDDIEANLNFDMLASPNFVRFVYDGDNSTGAGSEGPPGSAEIEQVFLEYFESQGLETEPTPFNGRSDYGPFIAPAAFVPAGGLFSGAEGVKTEEQAAIYGGAAGSWYDPCYHQACDTFRTVVYEPPLDANGLQEGQEAADAALMHGNAPIGLGQLADGAAHAAWTLARSRSPLVGPADAVAARTAKARRSYKAASRRAAKHNEWKGGTRVR
jgi:Zn-dependent M28 family amino/carboxypeptidase